MLPRNRKSIRLKLAPTTSRNFRGFRNNLDTDRLFLQSPITSKSIRARIHQYCLRSRVHSKDGDLISVCQKVQGSWRIRPKFSKQNLQRGFPFNLNLFGTLARVPGFEMAIVETKVLKQKFHDSKRREAGQTGRTGLKLNGPVRAPNTKGNSEARRAQNGSPTLSLVRLSSRIRRSFSKSMKQTLKSAKLAIPFHQSLAGKCTLDVFFSRTRGFNTWLRDGSLLRLEVLHVPDHDNQREAWHEALGKIQ